MSAKGQKPTNSGDEVRPLSAISGLSPGSMASGTDESGATRVTAIGPLGIEYSDPGDDPREQNRAR
jgi:hypothetical protein